VTRRFAILTIFPEIFDSFLGCSLIGKAIASGRLEVMRIDVRGFALDAHRSVDDAPYGGGAGMVMRPGPVVAALRAAPAGPRILLTPQGEPYTQRIAAELERSDTLVLACGRYEGFDERIRAHVDRELSLGDFVLHGGEVAAMALVESIVRLGEDVIGNPDSTREESFAGGLLEYPQYTRPRSFEGMEVPAVLLSGDHEAIRRWRRAQSLLRTARRRPDLVASLGDEDRALLEAALLGTEG
jgi:tRNA (guanine37-N1)-methyltransferase